MPHTQSATQLILSPLFNFSAQSCKAMLSNHFFHKNKPPTSLFPQITKGSLWALNLLTFVERSIAFLGDVGYN